MRSSIASYVAAIGVVVLAFIMMGIVANRASIEETVEGDVDSYVDGG